MAEDAGPGPADGAMTDTELAAEPASGSPPPDAAAALAAGQAAGNIHLATGDAETLAHSAVSREAADRQARLIAQVEERRRLRATVVPTEVGEVKQLLRQLEQPITMFGEREVSSSVCRFLKCCITHTCTMSAEEQAAQVTGWLVAAAIANASGQRSFTARTADGAAGAAAQAAGGDGGREGAGGHGCARAGGPAAAAVCAEHHLLYGGRAGASGRSRRSEHTFRISLQSRDSQKTVVEVFRATAASAGLLSALRAFMCMGVSAHMTRNRSRQQAADRIVLACIHDWRT